MKSVNRVRRLLKNGMNRLGVATACLLFAGLSAYVLVSWAQNPLSVRGVFERGSAGAEGDSPKELPTENRPTPSSSPFDPAPELTPVHPFPPGTDAQALGEARLDSTLPRFNGTIAGIAVLSDPVNHPPLAIDCPGILHFGADAFAVAQGSSLAIFPTGLPDGVAVALDPGGQSGAATTCDGAVIASGRAFLVQGQYGVIVQRVLRTEAWVSSHQPAERTSEGTINGRPAVFERSFYDDSRGRGRVAFAQRAGDAWLVTEVIGQGAPFSVVLDLAERLLQ